MEIRTRRKMERDLGEAGWGLDSSPQRLCMSLKDEQEKLGEVRFDVVRTLLGDLNHGAHIDCLEREARGLGFLGG